MPDIPNDVKQQAAQAALDAKNSLNVDALPTTGATMENVEQGPITVPGQGYIPGRNYNPAEPVPERPAPESPDELQK